MEWMDEKHNKQAQYENKCYADFVWIAQFFYRFRLYWNLPIVRFLSYTLTTIDIRSIILVSFTKTPKVFPNSGNLDFNLVITSSHKCRM